MVVLNDLLPRPPRRARLDEASMPTREALLVGDAEPALDLAKHQQAAVRGELPAVEAGDQRLAADW
jgi:hypothetical protein